MRKSKSIIVIVCYFGMLPDYFDLWLKSCGKNKDVDFILFTDQNINKSMENIRIENKRLSDMKTLFEKKLGMNIILDEPYKLCDFRPAYGEIFKEYLIGYDFWGHCDIDQIFGDIRFFLKDEVLEKYDRIFYLGHLSLYKNKEYINSAYKLKGSIFNYKEVFGDIHNYAFDEITGSKKIFDSNNIEIYFNDVAADINPIYSRFLLCNTFKNKKYQVFYWENGKVFRAYIENNNVKVDEFIYIHFQKRRILNEVNNINVKSFYILPNTMKEKKEGLPSIHDIKKYSLYEGRKKEKIEKNKYILRKIKQFINVDMKQKKIWIKQKIYK